MNIMPDMNNFNRAETIILDRIYNEGNKEVLNKEALIAIGQQLVNLDPYIAGSKGTNLLPEKLGGGFLLKAFSSRAWSQDDYQKLAIDTIYKSCCQNAANPKKLPGGVAIPNHPNFAKEIHLRSEMFQFQERLEKLKYTNSDTIFVDNPKLKEEFEQNLKGWKSEDRRSLEKSSQEDIGFLQDVGHFYALLSQKSAKDTPQIAIVQLAYQLTLRLYQSPLRSPFAIDLKPFEITKSNMEKIIGNLGEITLKGIQEGTVCSTIQDSVREGDMRELFSKTEREFGRNFAKMINDVILADPKFGAEGQHYSEIESYTALKKLAEDLKIIKQPYDINVKEDAFQTALEVVLASGAPVQDIAPAVLKHLWANDLHDLKGDFPLFATKIEKEIQLLNLQSSPELSHLYQGIKSSLYSEALTQAREQGLGPIIDKLFLRTLEKYPSLEVAVKNMAKDKSSIVKFVNDVYANNQNDFKNDEKKAVLITRVFESIDTIDWKNSPNPLNVQSEQVAPTKVAPAKVAPAKVAPTKVAPAFTKAKSIATNNATKDFPMTGGMIAALALAPKVAPEENRDYQAIMGILYEENITKYRTTYGLQGVIDELYINVLARAQTLEQASRLLKGVHVKMVNFLNNLNKHEEFAPITDMAKQVKRYRSLQEGMDYEDLKKQVLVKERNPENLTEAQIDAQIKTTRLAILGWNDDEVAARITEARILFIASISKHIRKIDWSGAEDPFADLTNALEDDAKR